ncbi:DegV family protein [Spiroplasma taiwanense]|uniref:DegV family protein n=1 Tax=Spiroplasma taiwanense CT-1 TaxID=1276220 RepID=S5MCW5_9MOLU|nr:DegV family protein [Spiroplasma taiwanense]AGR41568.1 DegV family protein [Spiroplasma taiwanense CT-1]
MKIGILVDSSAGIIEKNIESKIIKVIPLHLIVEDKDDFFDTAENIENNNLIDILKANKKTSTSQASPGELMNKYDEMLKEFDHIIHLTIPSNLSGMHETAVMVSKDDEYMGKVTVIKHSLAANTVKYLAFKYNEMINNGEREPSKFQQEADLWKDGTFISIIPGDFQKLAKGGRAKSLLVTILKMIKTKVAIHWLEKPKKLGLGRTYGAVLEKIYFPLSNEMKNSYELLIVYLNEASIKVTDQVKNFFNEKKVSFTIEEIPTVFPWHAGVDTIGIIAIEKSLMPKNK